MLLTCAKPNPNQVCDDELSAYSRFYLSTKAARALLILAPTLILSLPQT